MGNLQKIKARSIQRQLLRDKLMVRKGSNKIVGKPLREIRELT